MNQEHVTKICNAAREYVDRGWSVFPISYDKRIPLDEWKPYQTTFVHPDQIDDWEDNGAPTKSGARVSPFNLGLVTGKISGLIVLDCDSQDAIDFAKRNGMTSPIWVKTRRGCHYFFRHPGGALEFRNKQGGNPGHNWYAVQGLDLRGDGGFVVAAGSVNHKDGLEDHTYTFHIPEGMDFDDLPVWNGTADNLDTSGDFSFEKLDLSTTRLIDHNSLDVYTQVKELTAYLGRKLQGPDRGDATDNWMIKYCGQQVRRGVEGEDLLKAVEKFFNEFFDYHGSAAQAERWLKSKVQSAIDMDRRNHPQDYTPTGERLREAPVSSAAGSFPTPALLTPIYSDDVDRILASLGNVEYHADPIIPQQSIVQVVGYNGHGKSYFLTSLLMSMCAGQRSFGPYEFQGAAPKVFYMDFDNPARTVLSRMKRFNNQFGSTKDNFALWSASIIPPEQGGDINLTTDDGRNMLGNWLNHVQPNIVVLDTVRNAFGGFDENSAQEWFKVNHVAKMIRDYFKATVILVHHRNKPGDNGLGREAGSTAQLTNIDTQIIVTQCYEEKELAKKKAGIYTGETMVTIPNINGTGGEWAVNDYLMSRAKATGHPNCRMRMISEISFGKVRQPSELHDTHYIGHMEELADGASFLTATPSKKQLAQFYHARHGVPINQLAQELMVPATEIQRWMK